LLQRRMPARWFGLLLPELRRLIECGMLERIKRKNKKRGF